MVRSVGTFSERCPLSSLGSRDGLEDPLDDAGLVQQQLDQLSTIGRCEYEKTCALLVQLFDQSAQSYQELLQSASASPMDIAVQEGKCAVDQACREGRSAPFPSSPPRSHLPSKGRLPLSVTSTYTKYYWLNATED